MSGPKSPLSSPLTVPMATSSSGAADGGCLPASSTWPQKPEGEGMPWGARSREVNCAAVRGGAERERELTTGIENGPLRPAALQRAPLAVRTHHADVTLTLFSLEVLKTHFRLKSLFQLDLSVFYIMVTAVVVTATLKRGVLRLRIHSGA